LNKAIPMWRSRKAGGCALSVETISFCNGLCPECPRNTDPTKSRWHPDGTPIKEVMPSKHVYRIIDEAAELGWDGPIHLSHYSEPLLDPRIFKFAEYATDYGMMPELFTNGTRLTPSTIKQVDGLFPYIVLSYRTPGDKNYWQSQFKKSKVRTTDSYAVLIWGPDKELLRKSIDNIKDEPCINQPFTAFRINYNGQMSMCYADFNNEFGLLNAFEHSLEELWFGEEHVQAVQALSQRGGRQKFNLCRQCPRVYPDGATTVKVRKPKIPPSSWFKGKAK